MAAGAAVAATAADAAEATVQATGCVVPAKEMLTGVANRAAIAAGVAEAAAAAARPQEPLNVLKATWR